MKHTSAALPNGRLKPVGMSFLSFPSFLWWLPSVVGLFNASCWDGTFSEELCCEPVETEGKAGCWNELYKFEDCCPTWQFSGAYIGVQKHIYDKGLGSALVPFFQSRRARSILDLGAGAGWYVQTLRKASLRAGCFDGNRAVREVSQGRCLQADLSEEHDLGQRWDWVMSIEVAEHVPHVFETTYLNNLERHSCKGIIISWAHPNQAGGGHVNCKTRKEVQDLFEERGFWHNASGTSWLRRKAHHWWIQLNIMVFERKFQKSECE